MKKLSETALEKCAVIIQAIKAHPFNQELAEGSLIFSKFSYYIEQDILYLRDFTRALAIIASKVPLRFVKDFLSFSEGTLISEQEMVHDFCQRKFNLDETGKLTPATLSYTNYLLQVTSMSPVEVGIASVLPCFWVYNIVGQSIAQNTDMRSEHPYKRWIETYSSEAYSGCVQKAIGIFDEMALSASDDVRHLMLDAFYKSTVLEWHFWNDSYHQTIFDIFN